MTRCTTPSCDRPARTQPPAPRRHRRSRRAQPVDARPMAVATRSRGALIAGLRDLGASTIAMDVVFAEPDRYASGTPETVADRSTSVTGRWPRRFAPETSSWVMVSRSIPEGTALAHACCTPLRFPMLHPKRAKPATRRSSAPPGACAVCRCSPRRLAPPDS